MARMKRSIFFFVFALLFLVSIGFYFYPRSIQSLPKPLPTEVRTTAVKTESLPDLIKATANTLNKDEVEISTDEMASIKAIHFEAGQSVKKGDILIELGDSSLKEELQSARANFQLSQLSYNRILSLSKKNLASQQTLDEAKADLKNKQTELNRKLNAYNGQKLDAPFSGKVCEKHISPGALVSPGESLVKLIDNRTLKIQYRVPARFLPFLKPNQKVLLHSSLYPDARFEAVVNFISPMIDPNTRTILVEALFDNHDEKLASGLFLEVTHLLGNPHKRLMVPEESLVPTITGQKIYLVKPDNKVEGVSVKTGIHHNGFVEIVSGLTERAEVVYRGQHKLHDGSLIKPIKEG